MTEKQQTLQTVDRALSFLEIVAAAPNPPSIKDVSDKLDLNTTTCYHLLRTLLARGYVERSPNGGLKLGEAVNVLSLGLRRFDGVETQLAGLVENLAATTKETCALSIREGNHVTLKILVEGSQRLKVTGLHVGLKGYEYRRAAGQAVLAHLDEAARNAMLEESLTGLPGSQRSAILQGLKDEFSLISERGWAIDEQTAEGITAISSPFFAPSGEVLGALSLISPSFRLERARVDFFEALLSAAATATRTLRTS
ncbi:IclR family transcriptional regulator [Labrenzia sp. ac12]